MADRNEREVLNELIVTCRDGARGFQWAADHASGPDLREMLTSIATERRGYADALVPHAQRLGGHAEGEGSATATLHRAWITFKDKFAGNHDQSLLVEAERGERVALAAYAEALSGMLPPEARELVEAQHVGITATHDRLQAMMMKT